MVGIEGDIEMFTVHYKDEANTLEAGPFETEGAASHYCEDIGVPMAIFKNGSFAKTWYPWHSNHG